MNRFMLTVVFAGSLLASSTGFGLAARTFVATTGNDVAACSLAAPCRSFGAAIAQTASGGEVIVLDSGGYGAVSVSKDVSIIAPKGVYAGITVFPTSPNATGVTVYNRKVILRGLSINGQGGDTGIHVFGDAVVQIEDCDVSNVGQNGIRIGGAVGSPEVFVHSTMIHDNGASGIYATGSSRVQVDRTSSQRNGGDGLRAENGPIVTVISSVLSANSINGAAVYSDNGLSKTTLTVTDSTMAKNAARGLYAFAQASGSEVFLHAARNTIAANALDGILVDGATSGSSVAHANHNVVSKNGSSGIKTFGGTGVSGIVASNNDVFANAVGFHQQNASVFWTRGNNTVVLNYNATVGAIDLVSGY